jgi:hypothetical protein
VLVDVGEAVAHVRLLLRRELQFQLRTRFNGFPDPQNRVVVQVRFESAAVVGRI